VRDSKYNAEDDRQSIFLITCLLYVLKHTLKSHTVLFSI